MRRCCVDDGPSSHSRTLHRRSRRTSKAPEHFGWANRRTLTGSTRTGLRCDNEATGRRSEGEGRGLPSRSSSAWRVRTGHRPATLRATEASLSDSSIGRSGARLAHYVATTAADAGNAPRPDGDGGGRGRIGTDDDSGGRGGVDRRRSVARCLALWIGTSRVDEFLQQRASRLSLGGSTSRSRPPRSSLRHHPARRTDVGTTGATSACHVTGFQPLPSHGRVRSVATYRRSGCAIRRRPRARWFTRDHLVLRALWVAHDYLHAWAYRDPRAPRPGPSASRRARSQANLDDLAFAHLLLEAAARGRPRLLLVPLLA